jgi:hypothetical protein
MSTRFWVSISVLILLLGANAFLLSAEDFEVRSLEVTKSVDDPLAGMRYEGRREVNLKKMGFSPAMQEKILLAAKKIERQFGDRLQKRILDSAQKAQLSEDLCGRGVLPRRYMVMESVVKQDSRGRSLISIGTIQFESQDWFGLSNLEEMHKVFELVEGSSDDATVRILAAVLADMETEFLNSQGLWSQNDWDWGRLLKGHPNLEKKLADFSALALVVLERAQKALCGAE